MIKEVKYNGYSASPSDYGCVDGDLAMSLNAINEDGALRPILQPKFVFSLSNGNVVKCVHKTGIYTHYIIVEDNNILKFKENGIITPFYAFPSNIEIYQITPIGNTLVVLTSYGIYYFLWKDVEYISLGNSLPELNVTPYISTNLMNTTSFALSFGMSEMAETNTVISGSGYVGTDICKNLYNDTTTSYTLYGTVKQNVYERVFSIVNHYTTFLKRRGFFTEPFYVRFAYRMFDGSHVRHTAPVLLVPTTSGKPLMGVYINSNGSAIFNPVYSVSQLFANITVPLDIKDWYDIITDIDVYVTEPLVDYTDDVNSLISLSKISYGNDINKPKCMTYLHNNAYKYVWQDIPSLIEKLNNARYFIMPSVNMTFTDGVHMSSMINIYNAHKGAYFAFDTSAYQMLPQITNISGQVIANATSLNINIPGIENYTIFKIDESFNSLYEITFQLTGKQSVTLKTYIIHIDGEIKSKHFIDTKRVDGQDFKDVLTGYNTFYKISELNIREICDGLYGNMYDKPIPIKEGILLNLTTRQTLSDLGQNHNCQISKYSFNYNNRLNVILHKIKIKNACTSLKKQNPSFHMEGSFEEILMACVEIYENEQKIFVEIPIQDGSVYIKDLLSFSFPHNSARNLILYNFKPDKGYYKRIIPLKQHDFLNLSYAFNMFAPLDFAFSEGITEEDFVIPSVDTIEYGNIIRLSDVNNPFRFSEEYTVSLPVQEIYALSTAAKALSQGQFGQYPLYAFTSDGVWALELTSTGSYSARQPISRDVVVNVDSITQIDSAVLFATDRGLMLISGSNVTCISDKINSMDMFNIQGLPKANKFINLYDNTLSLTDIKLSPFHDFLLNCKMLYDYTHQHIIVYNPNKKYAYVYSLKSQQWGMMVCNIRENVNSYPEALAMTNNNRLVDFSQSIILSSKVLLITRPLKMGEPDVYKSISTIIQRGNILDNMMSQILYGSNDLNNWKVVWSSNNKNIRGLRGTPYKYYIIVMFRNLHTSESLHGLSLQYEHRLTNRLR